MAITQAVAEAERLITARHVQNTDVPFLMIAVWRTFRHNALPQRPAKKFSSEIALALRQRDLYTPRITAAQDGAPN